MPTFGPVNPDRDTHIVELNPTFNYGQRNTLWLDWQTTGACRILLAWDVSSIPVGAVVSSATLAFVVQTNTLSGATGYHAYAMTPLSHGGAVFIEGSGTGSATGDGATWDTCNGVDSWNGPGAGDDYTTLNQSPFSVTTGETTKSIDVKTAVQVALDNYRDSNGRIALLLKRDDESGSSQLLRFWSNQASTPSDRPVLTINYTLSKGAMTLLGVG